MAQYLLIAGGTIFSILGLLHAIYTIGDIYRPRHLAPKDQAVIDQMASAGVRLARGRTNMWDAWLGFNLSHGLGAVMFGLVCVGAGVFARSLAVPRDTTDPGVGGAHLLAAGDPLLVQDACRRDRHRHWPSVFGLGVLLGCPPNGTCCHTKAVRRRIRGRGWIIIGACTAVLQRPPNSSARQRPLAWLRLTKKYLVLESCRFVRSKLHSSNRQSPFPN